MLGAPSTTRNCTRAGAPAPHSLAHLVAAREDCDVADDHRWSYELHEKPEIIMVNMENCCHKPLNPFIDKRLRAGLS